jgi:plastocyanin
MKRIALVAALLAVVSTACGGGSQTRTVLVDYKHDEFAGAFLEYFPKEVDAHPGDTILFRQAWTGEPHSVTMGTVANKLGRAMKPYFKIFEEEGYAGLPPEPPKEIRAFERKLPWMVGEDGKVQQNGAQPCFLNKGAPPKKASQPCTDAQQRQPAFNGKQSYYNSGFIPYEGPNGDTFEMQLSDDIEPGRHFFYCNYHGEFMSGFLNVKPSSTEIASQSDVAKKANREIETVAKPLLREFRKAERGELEPPKEVVPDLERLDLTRKRGAKTYLRGWLSGLSVDGVDNATINEFIPRNVKAKVGEKITWVQIGGHSISFNVPEYFPIIQVLKNGTVRRNPKLDPPAGGAPEIPDPEESDGPPKPLVIDAGSWNGRGFWSSGVFYSESFTAYSLRITRPGTYKFACLIHPPMVGTLVVS